MTAARVKGLEEWNARMAKIPVSVREAMSATIDQNADDLASKLKGNTPRETGDLADTIRVENGKTSLSKKVSIGSKESPATYVEYGHMDGSKHVPPHPFFWPLWRVMAKRLRGRFNRAIKAAVRGYVAGGGS